MARVGPTGLEVRHHEPRDVLVRHDGLREAPLEQQGQPDTAYHYYQRLLRRAPGFLPATQKMLQYHLQHQQTKQAQRLLETALSYSYGEENRQRYQQKLNALQQWSAQTVHLPQ